MREGQAFAWQTLPVKVQPVLPGTVPVLAWFARERDFMGATHHAGPQGQAQQLKP
jgi:8-oxo-dGTP diphosphatase